MIPAYIAAEVLRAAKKDGRFSAGLGQCQKRLDKLDLPPAERVLRAEPVSAIIGLTSLIEGIIGGASITIFGATITAGAIGGAIVGVGLSIGLNYAAAALSRKTGAASIDSSVADSGLNTAGQRYNERQAVPSKRIIYGSVQVGGALCFEQVQAPFLYQMLLVSAKKITAFRRMWIGTQEISFSSMLPGTALVPLAISGVPDYQDKLRLSVRYGDVDQAIDPFLAASFTNLSTDFRQRGTATALIRYEYGADQDEYITLWGQTSRPNPLFLVDGIAIPDPRISSHITDWNPDDPDEVAAAEASWSFSNNASLVQAHYLTQRYGGRIRPDRLDWDKVKIAADWDDGLIACKDGTFIKRHTIDGIVTLNQSPVDVISGFLSANRGFVLEAAGRVWPASSPPLAPVATIHDGLLTGAIDYRAAKPKKDVINRLKVQFVADDREYQTVDGPVLTRQDLITKDGELLDGTLSLPFTVDDRRAQRLQKLYLDTSRNGRQLTVRCDVSLLAVSKKPLIGNPINFDSKRFPQCNGLYQCTQWGFADNFSSIDVSLVQYDPSIETAWNPATDEQDFVLADLDVS
jgi:hypothetical protein